MILKRPELYHGQSQKRPFFEGWYHKMSSKNGETFVAIPGIYRSGINNNQTAFLMFYQGSSGKVDYIPYKVEDFQCDANSYQLKLGKNYFSLERVLLDFEHEHLNVKGEIITNNLNPWPVSLIERGCMGWYGYIPTMECFHGILSMNHTLNGHLDINKDRISFDHGKGYIEKDWGKNFPKDWVWAQSNSFNESELSISASLATIPWKSYEFSGFIIGIHHKEKLYKFTTYNFSKILKIKFEDNALFWVIKKGHLQLEITIRAGSTSGLLHAPDKTDMVPKVREFLDGEISFILKKNQEIILEQYSDQCAVEIIGKTNRLIDNAIEG
tara:strand:- start:6063 stop:7040 length:978 start_codon:yes stop_codon:yes gene_type:complete